MSLVSIMLAEIGEEVEEARKLFPAPNLTLAALMEEVGELAEALLKGHGAAHVRGEAVQVAAMAIRVALDGDPSFDNHNPG